MISVPRALAVVVLVAAAIGLTGCTYDGGPDPGDSLRTGAASHVPAFGTSPIVFAFVCDDDDGRTGRTTTYTTYAAVWAAERTVCSAERIAGTEMSAQQRFAVVAADGDATLEDLAARCAVRGTRPWVGSLTSSEQAHVAAGLLEYCPGHPETSHLRDALAVWRG